MTTSTICGHLRSKWMHANRPSSDKSAEEVRQSIARGEREVAIYDRRIPHQTISYELYDAEGHRLTSVKERSRLFFHITLHANILFGPRYYSKITACKVSREGIEHCVSMQGFVEAAKLHEALEERKARWRR